MLIRLVSYCVFLSFLIFFDYIVYNLKMVFCLLLVILYFADRLPFTDTYIYLPKSVKLANFMSFIRQWAILVTDIFKSTSSDTDNLILLNNWNKQILSYYNLRTFWHFSLSWENANIILLHINIDQILNHHISVWFYKKKKS